MKAHFIPLILILFFNSILSAKPKETIVWNVANEPPITIIKNNTFQGYGINIIKSIQKNMPQYNHKIIDANNYNRLNKNITSSDSLSCAIGLFKTPERLKNMYFTKVPVFYFFDIQIALTEKTFKELGSPKKLSLEDLLNKKDFIFGLSKGRTYSTELREIIKNNTLDTNIIYLSQDNVSSSIVQMLMKNRITYMLIYPDEATYMFEKYGYKNKMVTVPIKETSQFGESWGVCSKTEKGKLVVDKITDVLLKIRQDQEYIDNFTRWVSQNLHEYYNRSFKEHFLKIYEN